MEGKDKKGKQLVSPVYMVGSPYLVLGLGVFGFTVGVTLVNAYKAAKATTADEVE